MVESYQMHRKHWEKEKLLVVLLFPQYFQRTCTADLAKPRPVWERVNEIAKW